MADDGRGNLVLTRKTGESVLIGADVTVTVVGIDRGQVQLRITAPRSVAVMREELLTRKEGGK